MNKLLTTLLVLTAMLAFSQSAYAVAVTNNDTLVINVTIQLDTLLEIEWDDGAGGVADDYAPRTWALGTAANVALSGTYDTQSDDPLALDVLNSSTVIPMDVTIQIDDAAGGWTYGLAAGADTFTLGYSINNGGSYTNPALAVVGNPGTPVALTTMAIGATMNFELEVGTPSSVTTTNSGAITVTLVGSLP